MPAPSLFARRARPLLQPIDPEILAERLEAVKAPWTSVGLLAGEDAAAGIALGYSPPPTASEDATEESGVDLLEPVLRNYLGEEGTDEPVLRAREVQAFRNAQEARLKPENEPAVPKGWDWRAVGGESFITSPRAQGDCGACVAFAVVAGLEDMCRIEKQEASLDVDLSEAELFFCHGGQEGATCASGWFITAALRACE